MIFAQKSCTIVLRIVGWGIGVGDTVRNIVAPIDRIADSDVATNELFHIARFIRVDARNRITVVVNDIEGIGHALQVGEEAVAGMNALEPGNYSGHQININKPQCTMG